MPSSGWNCLTTSKTRADPLQSLKKKVDSALNLLSGDALGLARTTHLSGRSIFMYKLEELDKDTSEQGVGSSRGLPRRPVTCKVCTRGQA